MTRRVQTQSISFRSRSSGLAPWGAMQTARYYADTELVSFNHPGWRSNTSGDSGGVFLVSKTYTDHMFGTAKLPTFEGGFAVGLPVGFQGLIQPYAALSNSQLDAKGTTAISRTEPTASVGDVATFIGELRADGLPRLRPDMMRSITKDAMLIPVSQRPAWMKPSRNAGKVIKRSPKEQGKAAGSDYLNLEFGWKPLVTDLRKMAVAVRDSADIIENYRSHGNGQKMRRRYAFPTQNETVSGTYGNFIPMQDIGRFGQGTIVEHRQQDTWFSGAFRYHVPVSGDQMQNLAVWRSNAQKLLGVSITPETVWNVQPWSWLVDWQTNVGDMLHNISAMGRDGLVLQYGYMMCHTSHEQSRCANFGVNAGYASATSVSYSKVRRPATPYGFGFDWNALSARQSAILAALAIQRV